MVRQGLRLDDPQAWQGFSDRVLAAGFDVVVLDPFADMHMVDENDAPAMRGLVNQFKALAGAGPALVVVHHTVKSAWGGATKDRPAALLSDARGHGGQAGSVDLSLGLVRMPREDDEENVRQAELYVLKDKDGILPKTNPEHASHRFTLSWEGGAYRTELSEVDRRAEKEGRQQEKELDKAARQRSCVGWVREQADDRSRNWMVRNRPKEFSERMIHSAVDEVRGVGNGM
jgi:RecA-family ATPase